jgi:putative restriction endonuclease
LRPRFEAFASAHGARRLPGPHRIRRRRLPGKRGALRADLRFTKDVFAARLGQPVLVRYWRVRHDKTCRQDLEGGYIWLPARNSGRALGEYSEGVREAGPGDLLFSRAGARIGHVGRVAGRALRESGPGGEGWWLPVDWTPLPEARPDPSFAGASFVELPEDLALDLLGAAAIDRWPEAPPEAAPDPDGLADRRLSYDAALAASVRDQTIRARRGQGLFRFRVFQQERACRLTGIARPDLLIASHIKPWRLCETTHERLDGANGLLLTPHVDRLFDRGLLAFADDGTVLRSPALPPDDLARLGLDAACARNAGVFTDAQRAYLASHRALVFDGGGR